MKRLHHCTVRKARTQMHETNKERDSAQAEATRLQQQLEDAQKEVSNVRNSVIVEKQSLEERLSDERRAKERARAQLEQRLNEVTQQKQNSKFKVRVEATVAWQSFVNGASSLLHSVSERFALASWVFVFFCWTRLCRVDHDDIAMTRSSTAISTDMS